MMRIAPPIKMHNDVEKEYESTESDYLTPCLWTQLYIQESSCILAAELVTNLAQGEAPRCPSSAVRNSVIVSCVV